MLLSKYQQILLSHEWDFRDSRSAAHQEIVEEIMKEIVARSKGSLDQDIIIALGSFHFIPLSFAQLNIWSVSLTPIHSLLSTHCYVQHFTVTMFIFLCLDQHHTFHSLMFIIINGSIPFTTPQTNTLENPHKEESPQSVPIYGLPAHHTREPPRSGSASPPRPMAPPWSGPTGWSDHPY